MLIHVKSSTFSHYNEKDVISIRMYLYLIKTAVLLLLKWMCENIITIYFLVIKRKIYGIL